MKKQKFWLNIELILIIVLIVIPFLASQTNITGFSAFAIYPEEKTDVETVQKTEEVLIKADVTNVEISETGPPPH